MVIGGKHLETSVRAMISLLGSFRLTLDGNLVHISRESKSEQLLISLALSRQRRVSRANLLERIWPQSDSIHGGQCLNSLTYQLNKLAKDHLGDTDLIGCDDGYYGLSRSIEVGVDIDYFEAWCVKGRRLLRGHDAANGVDYCDMALALYRGDLCSDSSIQAIIEQERLRNKYLGLLMTLANHHYTDQNPTRALDYIQRLLAHDPCREDAHRLAMYCFMVIGLRAQALRQYRICCQALNLEFEAKPEPATVNLYDKIRLDPIGVKGLDWNGVNSLHN